MITALPLNIEKKLTLSNLGRLTFTLYIFFILFGVSLPFQGDPEAVEDIVTTNPFRQLIFTALYFTAFLSIIPKFGEVVEFIKKEKFVILFLFWTFLSVVWSDFGTITFKRWIQVFGSYVVIIAGFLCFNDVEKVIKIIKNILIFYIIVTLISVLLVPEAKIYEGAWRGIAPHKNHLGQIMLISAIIWFDEYKKDIGSKFINFSFFFLSVFTLFGSRSTTSALAAFLIAMIAVVIFLKNYVNKYRAPLGNFIFIIFLLSLALIFILTPNYLIAPLDYFFNSLGKDLTFTGRTDLWARVLEEFKTHWVLGAGFQGFWVPENPAVLSLYGEFPWLPLQSHSGYVDLLNETGIVGFIIFIFIVSYYFIERSKLKIQDAWSFIFVAVLILNFQESSIFRTNVVSGIFFLIAYLKMFYHKTEME